MISLTATGSGYYRVYVNGAFVSQHIAEREAAEKAMTAKIMNPNSDVRYTHDYEVVLGGSIDTSAHVTTGTGTPVTT